MNNGGNPTFKALAHNHSSGKVTLLPILSILRGHFTKLFFFSRKRNNKNEIKYSK
jgi:hypothetical protein